jgi:hypothetical protein
LTIQESWLPKAATVRWRSNSDHRVRTIRARHPIDDREPIDLRNRRALLGAHPCGARQLVGHRESTLDGEARQRRVVLAHEHVECLAPMSDCGFQRRGPASSSSTFDATAKTSACQVS